MHSDGNHLCHIANEFCLAVLQETNPEFVLLPAVSGCRLDGVLTAPLAALPRGAAPSHPGLGTTMDHALSNGLILIL